MRLHEIVKTRWIVSFLILPAVLSAHKGAHQSRKDEQPKASPIVAVSRLAEVSQEYASKIKPIFQRSCFDCHSSSTQIPWYSELPLLKRVIMEDISEAREHMDMSNDFPFSGHGTPREDLEAIRTVLEKDEMPPMRYKLMHWNSKLSEPEVNSILQWVVDSLPKIPR